MFDTRRDKLSWKNETRIDINPTNALKIEKETRKTQCTKYRIEG